MPNPKEPTAVQVTPTTLQRNDVASPERRAQKQAGQDLAQDQAGGPDKANTNHNRPSEKS